jgi:hypothetical protein
MSPRTLALLAVVAVAGGGGVALAQSGGDPYQVPEPKLRAGEVLRLADPSGCDGDGRVKVRFSPPEGAVFGFFSVRVDGREVARLTGVPRAASATVALHGGSSRVRVEGETLGGQRVLVHRTYRRCGTAQAAPPPPYDGPVQNGGGED